MAIFVFVMGMLFGFFLALFVAAAVILFSEAGV